MTAIAIAQLPIGFVIAADGRMQMDAESRARASDKDRERETDDAQKIFEISDRDRTLGYAIKGTIANDDFSFDFVEEAKRQANFLRVVSLIRSSNMGATFAPTSAARWPRQSNLK